MVHELPEIPDRSSTLGADYLQACGGLPEVAPALGEHARPHGLLHREEGQEVVEDPVWESADAVDPRRHSVEQAAGIDSAGQGYQIKRSNCTRARRVRRERCAHLVAGVVTAISESEESESSTDDSMESSESSTGDSAESSVELMGAYQRPGDRRRNDTSMDRKLEQW